jgi:hypothetical protein
MRNFQTGEDYLISYRGREDVMGRVIILILLVFSLGSSWEPFGFKNFRLGQSFTILKLEDALGDVQKNCSYLKVKEYIICKFPGTIVRQPAEIKLHFYKEFSGSPHKLITINVHFNPNNKVWVKNALEEKYGPPNMDDNFWAKGQGWMHLFSSYLNITDKDLWDVSDNLDPDL